MQGMGITVVREIPNYAAYFFVYENLRRSLGSGNNVSTVSIMLAGGAAGMAAQVATVVRICGSV